MKNKQKLMNPHDHLKQKNIKLNQRTILKLLKKVALGSLRNISTIKLKMNRKNKSQYMHFLKSLIQLTHYKKNNKNQTKWMKESRKFRQIDLKQKSQLKVKKVQKQISKQQRKNSTKLKSILNKIIIIHKRNK